MASAIGGFRWNPCKVKYEPVLRFTTPTGELRQKILAESFNYNRLPDASTLSVIYDPSDPDFVEPSYAGARTVKPTTSVIIAASVALLVLAAMPPYLLFGSPGHPIRVSVAVGFSLGVLAALARPLRRRMNARTVQ